MREDNNIIIVFTAIMTLTLITISCMVTRCTMDKNKLRAETNQKAGTQYQGSLLK